MSSTTSPKKLPLEAAEKVLQLYREKYFDFNGRHFEEKLVEEPRHPAQHTWVKLALQTAQLVTERSRRGLLLHIDAGKHAWFGDGRDWDRITILDDATSEIYYAQLVEEEGTRTLMPAVHEVIEEQGIFCTLYSDSVNHFFVTPQAGEKVDERQVTRSDGH